MEKGGGERGGRRRGLKEKGKGNRQIDNGQGWGPGGLYDLTGTGCILVRSAPRDDRFLGRGGKTSSFPCKPIAETDGYQSTPSWGGDEEERGGREDFLFSMQANSRNCTPESCVEHPKWSKTSQNSMIHHNDPNAFLRG